MSDKGYQKDYSKINPNLLDEKNRREKALKIVSIINEFTNGNTKGLSCVDIGSSGGAITACLSDIFKTAIGLDIELEAIKDGNAKFKKDNLCFLMGDSMSLPFADDSVDVVVCNQVYEHVPDVKRLFDEIYRVLKKNGFCYFGAANRLTIKEPHYHLYFLSWLPKMLADFYMKITGKGDRYYEELRTRFGLKSLVKKFRVTDFTIKVLKNPEKYHATDMIKKNSFITKMPLLWYKIFNFAIPSYIWILQK